MADEVYNLDDASAAKGAFCLMVDLIPLLVAKGVITDDEGEAVLKRAVDRLNVPHQRKAVAGALKHFFPDVEL